MTLGGRHRGSRPAPTAVPRRKASKVAGACVEESFDGANANGFGPDQTWNVWNTSGVTPRRVSGALGVSHTASGTGTVFTIGRAEVDCGSVDMTTSVTVASVGTNGTSSGQFNSYSYNLLSRMELTAGGPSDMTSGLYTGWQFWYMNYGAGVGYCEIDLFYDPSSPSERDDLIHADLLPVLVPGDVLSIAVTGTGTGTVVLGSVNGSVVLTLSGTTLTDYLTLHSIDPADLPVGQRGGCGMVPSTTGTWAAGNDDKVALDSFAACPA